MKDYPPARLIHESTCPDAPGGLVLPASAFRDSHDRPHTCVTRDTIRNNRPVVTEHVEYERHTYTPSTIEPADATRKLCRVCYGTHPEDFNTVRLSGVDGP
ncbi:hypothetical protein [Actinoplanes sp. URMC 104]|uniref:hypothetical protein n=1 Tax=Actinoplanes sp. URMC 104 TaxID=3423409 RepID=UPI003F19CA21